MLSQFVNVCMEFRRHLAGPELEEEEREVLSDATSSFGFISWLGRFILESECCIPFRVLGREVRGTKGPT